MSDIALALTSVEAHVLVGDGVLVPGRRSRLKELLLVPASAEERRAARAAFKARGLPDGRKPLLTTRFGRELECLTRPRAELLLEHTQKGVTSRRFYVAGEHDLVEVTVKEGLLELSAARPRAEGVDAITSSVDWSSTARGLEPVVFHPDQLQGLSLLWAGQPDGAPRALSTIKAALAPAGVAGNDVDALVASFVDQKVVLRSGDTVNLAPAAASVLTALWTDESVVLWVRQTPESELPQFLVDEDATQVRVVGTSGHRLLVTPFDGSELEDEAEGLEPAEAKRLGEALVFSRVSARVVSEVVLEALADADDEA